MEEQAGLGLERRADTHEGDGRRVRVRLGASDINLGPHGGGRRALKTRREACTVLHVHLVQNVERKQ